MRPGWFLPIMRRLATPESPSDVIVGLSEDGSKVTILSGEGSGGTYLRSEIMNRPVTEASAIVVVESYWPDFVMKAGRPGN